MKRIVFVAAATLAASSAWANQASSQAPTGSKAGMASMEQAVTVNSNDLKWGPAPAALPKGAELAVLDGNPDKPGNFDLMVRMPSNYKVPMHWHSKAESLTIVSGKLGMTHADTVTELGVGGYSYLPAKMKHQAVCLSNDGCVFQLHGMGPFDIHYVNPSDDPRTQRQARTPKPMGR